MGGASVIERFDRSAMMRMHIMFHACSKHPRVQTREWVMRNRKTASRSGAYGVRHGVGRLQRGAVSMCHAS